MNFGAGTVPAQTGGVMTLPAAVAARVRPLHGSTAVPLVCYGGLDPAGGASVADLQALEDGVLAPTRATLLGPAPPVTAGLARGQPRGAASSCSP